MIASALCLLALSSTPCTTVKDLFRQSSCCQNSDNVISSLTMVPKENNWIESIRMTSNGIPYMLIAQNDGTPRQTIIDFPGAGIEIGQFASLTKFKSRENNKYNLVIFRGDITMKEWSDINLGGNLMFCSDDDYLCNYHYAIGPNTTKWEHATLEVMDNLVQSGYATDNNFIVSGTSLGIISGLYRCIMSESIMSRVEGIMGNAGVWSATTGAPDMQHMKQKKVQWVHNPNDKVVGPFGSYDATLTSFLTAMQCNGAEETHTKYDRYEFTRHNYNCENGLFEHVTWSIDEDYPQVPLGYAGTYAIDVTHLFMIPETSNPRRMDFWNENLQMGVAPYMWSFLDRFF